MEEVSCKCFQTLALSPSSSLPSPSLSSCQSVSVFSSVNGGLGCYVMWLDTSMTQCFSFVSRHRDEPKVPDSGATSDEENEDGDFTVYECPGLAPVRDGHT